MCWRGTCLYDNQSEKYERNAAGNLLRGTCLSGNYFRNQTETNLLPSEQHAKKTWLILHNISPLWGWDGDDDDGKGKNNLDTYSFFDGYGFDGDSDDDEDDCYGRGGCIGSGGGGIGGRDYDEDEAVVMMMVVVVVVETKSLCVAQAYQKLRGEESIFPIFRHLDSIEHTIILSYFQMSIQWHTPTFSYFFLCQT